MVCSQERRFPTMFKKANISSRRFGLRVATGYLIHKVKGEHTHVTSEGTRFALDFLPVRRTSESMLLATDSKPLRLAGQIGRFSWFQAAEISAAFLFSFGRRLWFAAHDVSRQRFRSFEVNLRIRSTSGSSGARVPTRSSLPAIRANVNRLRLPGWLDRAIEDPSSRLPAQRAWTETRHKSFPAYCLFTSM